MHNFNHEQLEQIKLDKIDAAKYKKTEGRYDPFNLDLLWHKITNQVYSDCTKQTIQSLPHACQDAQYICHGWYLEDKKDAEVRRKEMNRLRQQKFQENKRLKNAELNVAKANWQKAVADRKAIMEQWDSYVAHLRHIYNELKLRSQNA